MTSKTPKPAAQCIYIIVHVNQLAKPTFRSRYAHTPLAKPTFRYRYAHTPFGSAPPPIHTAGNVTRVSVMLRKVTVKIGDA